MESLFRSNSNEMIVTKFCAWHDSFVIVSCAKKWCNPMTRKKKKFPSNCNCDRKLLFFFKFIYSFGNFGHFGMLTWSKMWRTKLFQMHFVQLKVLWFLSMKQLWPVSTTPHDVMGHSDPLISRQNRRNVSHVFRCVFWNKTQCLNRCFIQILIDDNKYPIHIYKTWII